MKDHRIFIAINLPEKIKEELFSYSQNYPSLPARWTKKNNLHITLSFLGNVKNEEILKISDLLKSEVEKSSPFSLSFNKITYSPDNKNLPRMVWAMGEKNPKLLELKNLIDSALFQTTTKIYQPHITLARIRMFDFKSLDLDERPDINQNIDLNFTVESIEIMESKLKKGGAEYNVFESLWL